jgi:hypothetical protein
MLYTGFTLALVTVFFAVSAASAGLSLSAPAEFDLSSAMQFERYLATGSTEEIEKLLVRLDSVSLTNELKSSAKGGKAPLTLVVYGWMSCPDCEVVVPYVEAIKRLNPSVSTLYFGRTDESRDLMRKLVGVYRTPTVFAASADGTLLGAYYLEYPISVRERMEAAVGDDAKKAVIKEFRGDKYDLELQKELTELLENAWRAGRAGR